MSKFNVDTEWFFFIKKYILLTIKIKGIQFKKI